jgi:hypothetical protein
MPVSGRIVEMVYRPGLFLNAELAKASDDNERNGLVIETASGRLRYGVVQIAGLIARRIVPFVREGETLEAAPALRPDPLRLARRRLSARRRSARWWGSARPRWPAEHRPRRHTLRRSGEGVRRRSETPSRAPAVIAKSAATKQCQGSVQHSRVSRTSDSLSAGARDPTGIGRGKRIRRHCERSEAIQGSARDPRRPAIARRFGGAG